MCQAVNASCLCCGVSALKFFAYYAVIKAVVSFNSLPVYSVSLIDANIETKGQFRESLKSMWCLLPWRAATLLLHNVVNL